MTAGRPWRHHREVGPRHFVVTKTHPKHLVNRHLTSLASGVIIDETGRRCEDSRSGEAVCLGTLTKKTTADGQARSLFPRQVR